jgi:proteasome lid subunit RPN8/RPN11
MQKRKEERRGMLQTEVTYKAETINNVKYLNTKYKDDQFVYTVHSHTSYQPNMK